MVSRELAANVQAILDEEDSDDNSDDGVAALVNGGSSQAQYVESYLNKARAPAEKPKDLGVSQRQGVSL